MVKVDIFYFSSASLDRNFNLLLQNGQAFQQHFTEASQRFHSAFKLILSDKIFKRKFSSQFQPKIDAIHKQFDEVLNNFRTSCRISNLQALHFMYRSPFPDFPERDDYLVGKLMDINYVANRINIELHILHNLLQMLHNVILQFVIQNGTAKQLTRLEKIELPQYSEFSPQFLP